VNASLIDVAIVLVGIYIALAVAASWVQEQIAALSHLRGRQLYRGILNLVAGATTLTDAIYAHPLVSAAVDNKQEEKLPSYLDARNFSLALWQSVHQTVGPNAGLRQRTLLPRRTSCSPRWTRVFPRSTTPML